MHKKRSADIVDALRAYIATHPDEKHIIFMGDYMYHFQFHRESLLLLYAFWLELVAEGKYIYVLAGNHDWLYNLFIYEEGKRTYEASVAPEDQRIRYITEPVLKTIEGQDILFFPYSPFIQYTGEEQYDFAELAASDHPGEQLSAQANQLLYHHIHDRQKTQTDNETVLWVVHHRYIANTVFTGQKARFSYKQHALSPALLDHPQLRLISGHLHQPFIHKNYLCTGSMWYTSPLETNHVKYLYRYAAGTITASPIFLNPYIQMPSPSLGQRLDEETLHAFLTEMVDKSSQSLSTSEDLRNITLHQPHRSIDTITLSLVGEDMQYMHMDDYIAPELYSSLAQVKLESPEMSQEVAAGDIITGAEELDTSIADWKGVLRAYLTKKYPDTYEEYIEYLDNLQIL